MKWFAALVVAVPLVCNAQSWPQRAVKVVVPFPPGGVTDSIARITADWLAPRLGQPVVAENRPGASGAIAAEFVARADLDRRHQSVRTRLQQRKAPGEEPARICRLREGTAGTAELRFRGHRLGRT